MLYGPPESQVKALSGSQARPSGASLNETHGAGKAPGVVLLRPQA